MSGSDFERVTIVSCHADRTQDSDLRVFQSPVFTHLGSLLPKECWHRSFPYPARPGSSAEQAKARKAKAASAAQFVEREKPRLLAAAQLAMAGRVPTRSPLAKTLTVVS
jgi:hypothetical protein